MSNFPANDFDMRTNPATGAVEFVPKRMSTAPEPIFNPGAFRPSVQRSITVHDNDAPGARSQTLTLGFIGNTSREQAQRAFAKVQDRAISEGLYDPVKMQWSTDGTKLRAVELAQLQLEQARSQVAYCATVEPALAEQRAAMREVAEAHEQHESITKLNKALEGKPFASRVLTLEQGSEKQRVIIGGPAWPEGM